MARQSHRPSGSNDPQDQVPPPTMHTGKDPQRQHRAGEFEFEWDASRREATRPERSDPAPTSAGQSTKRRRIALACNVCRARKSKCDGARPQCSLCSELGFECQYLQSASYSNVIIGKEYLSLIEDRLKEVESRVNSLENNGTPPALAAPRVPLALPSTSTVTLKTEPTEATPPAETSLESADTVEDLIDGMGTVTIAPDEDSASFGPSSNIAFLGKICKAVARLSHDPQPWKPSLTRRTSAGYTGSFSNNTELTSTLPIVPSQVPEVINIYTLPSEAVSRELLARYFSNAGLLFPYVHERTFMATFDQACHDGFKGVKRTWLGLLNIIFAHAVVHEGDPGVVVSRTDISSTAKFTEQSEIYYKRASGLCSQQIANATGVDVEVVQYLLLQVQYLQSSQRSAQTWATHGLAVRAAFQLGLYSSDLAKAFPPLEQEIWKKTWFGCVILDRTLSMTFGRPPVIPDSYVKLKLPVPYIAVDPPRTLTERDKREPLSVGFYNGTITLYKILHTVIELLYGNNIACSTSPNSADTIARVYQIESQLADWQQTGLPHDLKLISLADLDFDRLPPEDEAMSEQWRRIRLRFVLTLRYANVRILLHRTVLVKFLEGPEDSQDSQDTTLLHGVGWNSIEIAKRSAKEIICLVRLVVQSPVTSKKRGLLGAWWFSLYYTFNAALVLVGCILVSLDQNTADMHSTQDLIRHLRMSVEALWDLDRDNRMVARCREYLDQLVHVVYTLAAGRGQILETDESRSRGLVHSSLRPMNNDGTAVYPPGAAGGVMHGAYQKQSPLGMELGEFMLDGDLDFLSGQIFDYNRGVGGM